MSNDERTEGSRGDAADAGRAVGEPLGVHQHQADRLGEGEGRHRQVVAAQLQGGHTEQESEQRRDD